MELRTNKRINEQIASAHNVDDEDEDWSRGWSDAVTKESTSCPACGGLLTAVGLTPDERARIRDALFGLAGLQVKKHARNRYGQRYFVDHVCYCPAVPLIFIMFC